MTDKKYYFTNRVVPVWNGLPNDVVMADNINVFKNGLSCHHMILLSHLRPEV